MPQLTTQYSDIFYDTALPALETIIQEKYKIQKSMIPQLFNIIKHDREIYQSSSLSGFLPAVQRNEGDTFFEDNIVQTFNKTYTITGYGIKEGVTEEMMKYDRWQLMAKRAIARLNSINYTKEKMHVYHFDNAFDAGITGPDGQALCSTSHPLVKAGGTSSNRLSPDADLSFESLRRLRLLFSTMLNDNGMLVSCTPKFLVYHPDNDVVAKQLLNSQLMPENATNATNPFSNMNIVPIEWPYLADTDAFFLMASKEEHSLESIVVDELRQHERFDEETLTGYYYLLTRFASGFSDWRGITGSAGA